MPRIDQLVSDYLSQMPADRRRRTRTVGPRSDGHVEVDGRALINFSANDYLGLGCRRLLDESSEEPAACASRLISGSHPLCESIESTIASLKGTESALIFGTGFQVNASVLPTLLSVSLHGSQASQRDRPNVQVFTDRLVHASFHAGLAAAGVKQIRFRHNDLDHLEKLLSRSIATPEKDSLPAARMILTESVFSMDGDCLDVNRIRQLADRYDASLYVDEAHATGVMGENGMGLMCEVSGRRADEVVIGTFSKALGCFGAYVACSQNIRDYLVNRCAGLIYSTALPPLMLNRIARVLEIVPGMSAQRVEVQEMATQLRCGLNQMNIDTLQSASQIVPAIIGSDADTMRLAAGLEEDGFMVGAIRPPTVPEGTARLRMTVTANHDPSDIDQLLAAIARRLGARPT